MTERRTRRVTAENAAPIGDEQPWADVVDDLLWGELKTLIAKAPLDGAPYDAAAEAIAQYVMAWNIEGRNADTGEKETLPPPAEAGPSVFDCVEPWVISWLFITMHTGHKGGAELQKKPTPINATPDSKKESA